MNAVQIIRDKRDGRAHAASDLRVFLDAAARGDVPDYQVSAWLMAAYLQGLNDAETVCLTSAIRDSGDHLSLQHIPLPKVDKHSTGGVGDKTSIVLVPLLAAAGVCVPMMSGRGLGHTGGTLDKLEAMPGMTVQLPVAEYIKILEKYGGVFMAQTPTIAPLDGKLYALRDVTGTVESIPLITASIIGKKATEGLDALVLDVKWGDGAFMHTFERAQMLARSLVNAADGLGIKTVALITDMNEPLGEWIGNAVETREALAMLAGEPVETRFRELTLALATEMLRAAQPNLQSTQARSELEHLLANGDARALFDQIIAAQGVAPKTVRHLSKHLEPATQCTDVTAVRSGFLQRVATARLGQLLGGLGAGRARVSDRIDPAISLRMLTRIGDRIDVGQPFAQVFTHAPADINAFRECFTIGDEPPMAKSLIVERVSV